MIRRSWVLASLVLFATGTALAASPVGGGSYRGKNSRGARASLKVAHDGRRIVRLNAGAIRVRCSDGSKQTEPTKVADILGVRRNGRFRNNAVNFTSGNAGGVAGQFVSGHRVRGRVAVSTREDCFGRASFTLKLARR
jgi:hypothetical protein